MPIRHAKLRGSSISHVYHTLQCTAQHEEGKASIGMLRTGNKMESRCVEVTQLATGPRPSGSLSSTLPETQEGFHRRSGSLTNEDTRARLPNYTN